MYHNAIEAKNLQNQINLLIKLLIHISQTQIYCKSYEFFGFTFMNLLIGVMTTFSLQKYKTGTKLSFELTDY